MKTLLLTRDWDVTLDQQGNLALASDPLSQAQDAASEIKLFRGELWYDTRQGIPYWQEILGKLPPVALMQAKFRAAALRVPGVVTATVSIDSVANREVVGQVVITNAQSQRVVFNF